MDKDEQIVGVLLRGEPYDGLRPFNSYNWLWLTSNQFTKMMRDQDDPDRKGRFYLIGDRMVGLKDIAIVRKFTVGEIKERNFYWKPTSYLLKAIQKEKEFESLSKGGNEELSDGQA